MKTFLRFLLGILILALVALVLFGCICGISILATSIIAASPELKELHIILMLFGLGYIFAIILGWVHALTWSGVYAVGYKCGRTLSIILTALMILCLSIPAIFILIWPWRCIVWVSMLGFGFWEIAFLSICSFGFDLYYGFTYGHCYYSAIRLSTNKELL